MRHFSANTKFFGQKPAAKKMKKMFVKKFIQNEKGIHSVQQYEVPEIRVFFSNNYWVG